MATPAWVGELALRHLDAAYNLARWLLGNESDAADAVHDAYLRAARGSHTYAGGDARGWWLAIVRNCCLAKLSTRKREMRLHVADGPRVIETLRNAGDDEVADHLYAEQCSARIARGLHALPAEFREALVLREIEGLSYRGIADVLGIPIGTVMSRLARGRAQLQRALVATTMEGSHGL
ncbi:sigma-70 family RNA polymerase sigma factor [Solilutibacter silvestris]|uniref:Sigma70-ECF: RNA polymerase sigma factor, sigma-70 family n=1 Tax=Solilutibacter silvestris TaxID=1645665 RepID=A0A2K1PX90_9GAMM|nr:sigma-70 family RNA polymerase sigma factor [Lysobacter silvestris]PNS07406.1 sigma70-ECF: RNA polymerase sigma factor, sigma-70 family [Lysobacter silvestris]